MKNKIIIEKDETKEEYNILLKIDTQKDQSYVVYTKNELNEEGEIIAYASSFITKDGKLTLEPIEDEYTLEFLDKVLLQVQNKMDKEVGE